MILKKPLSTHLPSELSQESPARSHYLRHMAILHPCKFVCTALRFSSHGIESLASIWPKVCSRRVRAYVATVKAFCWPTQIRWPPPKGCSHINVRKTANYEEGGGGGVYAYDESPIGPKLFFQPPLGFELFRVAPPDGRLSVRGVDGKHDGGALGDEDGRFAIRATAPWESSVMAGNADVPRNWRDQPERYVGRVVSFCTPFLLEGLLETYIH